MNDPVTTLFTVQINAATGRQSDLPKAMGLVGAFLLPQESWGNEAWALGKGLSTL